MDKREAYVRKIVTDRWKVHTPPWLKALLITLGCFLSLALWMFIGLLWNPFFPISVGLLSFGFIFYMTYTHYKEKQ